VLIALVSVVDWLALRQISRADADLDAMVDARWERVELAREAQSYSSDNSRMLLQTFVTDNQEEINALLAQAADNSRHISELIDSLRSKADTPEERDLLADIQTKRETYRASCRRAVDLHIQAHKPDEARVLMAHEVSPLLVVYHQAVDDYVQHQGKRLDEAQAANVEANAKALREALILIFLATLLALAIAIIITTYTSKQLARRVRAEAELRKAHHQLEAKVVTRTAALLEANHRLETEAAERQMVECALRESEQRYRLLFESNPLPMWVFDLETLAFLAVNDAAVSHYGYSRDEFLKMTIADIRPAEEIGPLHAARESSRGDFGVAPGVWWHRKKDGTLIDVEINWHVLEFSGRPAKVVSVNDITERTQAENESQRLTAQLEVERTRLTDIIASLPGIVWECRRNGSSTLVGTFVSDYVEKMLGYSPEEWLSMPGGWFSAVHPEDQERLKREIVANKDVSESRWIAKDGRVVHSENRTAQIFDEVGQCIGLRGVTLDITERKRSESEVLLQTARFHQLFENTPMGIVMVDENDAVVDANREFERMFEFSLEELQGHSLNEMIVPREMAEEAGHLSALTFRREVVQKEATRCGKSGRLLPVEIYCAPIVANDRLMGVFAIYLDLAHRKRLELERQVVFDITQGAISTADIDDLFKHIHTSISKVLYAENCFVALHDPETDLLHYDFWVDQHDRAPQPRPVGLGFSSYVLQTGRPILLTEEITAEMVAAGIVQQSGTSSPSWLGVPLRTASRIIGVLAVQHYSLKDAYTETDLQFLDSVGSQIAMAIERKRSEQALVEANKRALADYESLVERIAALGRTLGTARELKIIFRALRDFAVVSAPCEGLVISLYDREKESRRIVYCWTDGEELDSSNGTEVPVRDGMIGRAIKSGAVVIDNDYRAALAGNPTAVALGSHVDRASDRSALAAPMTVMGRTVGCVEVQCLRVGAFENGHATAMRMAANLAANAIENVVLIEREQEKEEQLRQAQKMESIGTLAGGIAHDFNNLMTAVTGYSDLALRGSLDDSLRGKIEQIKKAGERAATLTRQLLAFSRKQMLQPEVLDLNVVVNGLITMLPRLIGEHIVVSLKLSSSLGRIKADPGQIEQVLINLAVNGRDAMPQGGCLMIETRNVHLSAPISKVGSTIEPGHYVLLSVSDNGTGMDAEIQAQIFEPFFTTKGVGKGTGLGLSTVYGIVKQSGGNVWVYSEPGNGTAFKIYLPRVDEVENAEIALPAPAASRGNETILLVEDEEQVRNLSKEILEAYGYSVLVAQDGSAGLSLGKEFPGRIDLVLTDVIMPQMGGKELADHLKSVRPESKVLFMSGFTDGAITHHVSDDGVFFLQKPFSTEGLATKVREVLDQ
jgi:PAS domain S-box-containing protein